MFFRVFVINSENEGKAVNLREHLVPVIGFVLVLISQIVWQMIGQDVAMEKVVRVGVFSVLLYTLLLSIYTWFYSKPHQLIKKQKFDFDEFITKIDASVNKLIQKQRFIDQATLDLIEKQADNIWVVTTNMASEITKKSLQLSVEENLRKNKKYTYFLPHPANTYFEDVDRNLKKFKALPLYQEYKSNIRIIRLPIETQFLLEEVVIYNPDEEENFEDNTKGLNGFTFYESKEEGEDSLHMKIEGGMLKSLRNRLNKYLEVNALRVAAEQVLTEFADKIEDDDKPYVANLMAKTEIIDIKGYDEFMLSLRGKEVSKHYVDDIDRILGQYKIVI